MRSDLIIVPSIIVYVIISHRQTVRQSEETSRYY